MTAHVTLVGTLGRDPELRYTPSGSPVVNFSMGTTITASTRNCRACGTSRRGKRQPPATEPGPSPWLHAVPDDVSTQELLAEQRHIEAAPPPADIRDQLRPQSQETA